MTVFGIVFKLVEELPQDRDFDKVYPASTFSISNECNTFESFPDGHQPLDMMRLPPSGFPMSRLNHVVFRHRRMNPPVASPITRRSKSHVLLFECDDMLILPRAAWEHSIHRFPPVHDCPKASNRKELMWPVADQLSNGHLA
jgi:hypothetical protein